MMIGAATVILFIMYATASHTLIARADIVGDIELKDGTILKQKTVIMKKNIKANLNDNVKFKLTEEGRIHVKALNRHHPVYSHAPLVLKEDGDGWCRMTLWEFASIFGETFMCGLHTTVETSIIIETSED